MSPFAKKNLTEMTPNRENEAFEQLFSKSKMVFLVGFGDQGTSDWPKFSKVSLTPNG